MRVLTKDRKTSYTEREMSVYTALDFKIYNFSFFYLGESEEGY